MIKAVIFDMDGVLIDAKEWHYEALNKALNLFGQNISRYDHLVTYDGLPTKKKLEMLSLENNLPKGLHQLINDIKQINTLEMAFTMCKPRFIHQRALSKLKEDGYKLGVCSNSIRQTVDIMMEKSDLQRFLDNSYSNQDVSKGKPDPEMYIKMINFFGLDPKECLIVEDNENGIKAAKASGAHLLKVETVDDVYYENIKNRINQINEGL
ncbi:HAD family hydrolase [Halobacteriovorax sp. DPLXC-1]|uniref:HAD family hydrolase n=1 Tax=Halobacteriovorax sp. DPLXC-1 TaxID=3110771 RepID=UPI002FEF66FE